MSDSNYPAYIQSLRVGWFVCTDYVCITELGRNENLHKKLAAALTISIFIISIFAIMTPVQAHFTLGDLTGTYRYHDLDFDPHTDGIIGYVWPGGGQNAYVGFPNLGSNTLSPGYQSPYPGGNPPWAGGGDSPTNWLQLEGHEYAPFGAVLAGSTGDLIFAINSTDAIDGELGWDAWFILIPPEFGGVKGEQVVTTVTNNYADIAVKTLSMEDRYAPGWTLVIINPDMYNLHANAHSAINFTADAEWYYARVNGLTAPTVAGRYFFKMGVGANTVLNAASTGYNTTMFIPTENWPVMLVKGEIDPAIITGTIRYGGYNSTLYGNPIEEPGRVWAHMTAKIDPYTNNQMTNCLDVGSPTEVDVMTGCVDAVGYFNKTAVGHYEVEGVAPGVYDLYAEAAGFPQELIATGVTVLKGQSLHFDGYLNPGVVIHGNVFTKHQFGEEPWMGAGFPYNEYIKIELYDQPTVNHQVAADLIPVSWSPLPCVAGGQDLYVGGHNAGGCGDPRAAGQIAFPWHEYITPGVNEVLMSGGTASTDPLGVGPLQYWYVLGGTTTPFHYEFGAKGQYGAPRDVDGHVPQVYATWVNGLTAGRYYVRAWVFRYVQSALDGSTFQEYYFDVTPKEWAGDVTVPLDLRLSSWVNKTVHFHDRAGLLNEDNMSTGAAYLYGMLKDEAGAVWAFNVTDMASKYDADNNLLHMNIEFWGINDTWSGENYGIPSGTYTPYVYALGYLQQTFEKVSVTLSGNPTYISDHLYRGVGFNMTLYSIDWERPRVNRNWVWDNKTIEIAIFSGGAQVDVVCDWCNNYFSPLFEMPAQNQSTYMLEVEGGGEGRAHGAYFGYDATRHHVGGYSSHTTLFNRGVLHSPTWYLPTAFESGQYSFRGWTYGYIQNKEYSVYANKGEIADIKINLIIGVNVTVDILFKKEHIITPTEANMSARVRLFDDSGELLATWMSSEGVYVSSDGRAAAADNTNFASPTGGPWNDGLWYLPGGVELLHVNLVGLPVPTSAGEVWGDPIFTGAGSDFEADNWADGIATHFRNGGIPGSPDYTGSYTVEVDFVNWYANNTALTANYYPPVGGLLLGESYHFIAGSPVAGGFGFTEQGALDAFFLGHSMAPNHLGPYRQEGTWVLSNAHNSGEASGIFEVDMNGLLSGNALAFTWSTEFRPVSWATVTLSGVPGGTFTAYSTDGLYEFYTGPSDTAMLTITIPGHESQSASVSISDGMSSTGQNFYLEQSGIPVPEFSGIAVVVFSALAASLYLLRRRRR
jgi:hypothetical protein